MNVEAASLRSLNGLVKRTHSGFSTMTPFGNRLRELRREKNVSQKEMAAEIGVSAAYLSALENGHRGQPTWAFIQRVIGYFNVIWDDAEELERLALISHPKITIDTASLPPSATELTNLLARDIHLLSEEDLDYLIHQLKVRLNRIAAEAGSK